ncbi:MAG: DnaA family protein [Cellvibrionaceae bacterium]
MYKQIPLAISPDTGLTFDNFYQSDPVKPIISELKKFVSNLESHGGPFLYLWGEKESGVTHLLNAVQNHSSSLSMQYLPLEELIQYSPFDILEGVEQMDLVCIDDIDYLESNSQWQESIFYLYNRLRDGGKKLVVGGHQPPTKIALTLSDLQSRLQWGITLCLHGLTNEDKPLAIQFYAKSVGMELTNEVARYLMQRTDRSSRALFDLMKRLDHASLSEQRKLTIPFIKTLI